MSLSQIQRELKAPKNQFNEFGRYKYRSAEDIIEAVKPLLHDYKYSLNLSDDVIEVGGRVYVKATASIWDESRNLVGVSTGWAREAPEKKGMDQAMLTGSCSTYARKYALNGLFAIDETSEDMDFDGKTLNESTKLRGDRQIAKQDSFIKIREFYDQEDAKGLIEESAKLREDEELLNAVWGELTSKQKEGIKKLMHNYSQNEGKS